MKSVCLLLICLSFVVSTVWAVDFDFGVRAGSSVPVGNFSDKKDIVTPKGTSYKATGGGAQTGFAFDIELGVGVHDRMTVGGYYGYSRCDADASDLCEKLIKPHVDVESIDANWTLTYLGLFARFDGVQTDKLSLFGKLGMGMVKVTNSFDLNLAAGAPVRTESGEFDLGNQFHIGIGFGLEYGFLSKASLVAEIGFRHIFSKGASASTTVLMAEITGEQQFNIETLSISAGVRIPLSGI